MLKSLIRFALLAILALVTGAQEPAEPFPASTALEAGVSPDAIVGLDRLVQGFVDDEEIVGAELLVVVGGRTVHRAAYGWSDRESDKRMETGSVFCVRSMTKPTIAAAILMLAGDGALELDDLASEYVPAFDAESTRDITIEQLLTHTSGLPMSLLLGKELTSLEGIGAVAALAGGHALEFEPGTSFHYSDQGTDTLTAIVEVVSGMPAAEFIETRLLAPLGMASSATVMTADHPLRLRAISKYAGSRGSWERFWSPDDEPLFPFFLGSQGLYSTTEDYARFMRFWLDRGRSLERKKLLSARLVKKAFVPGPHPMNGPTGLPALSTAYGMLMQLWTGEEGDVVAFGHTGSDGTHAWVFPEHDAIALYFTQSRNNSTGLRVEEALGELFLGVPFDANQLAPPFEQYLGYYWEGEGDIYRAIIRDGEDMALEILGKGVVPLSYLGEDRWRFRDVRRVVLEFQRSESGEVTGYRIDDHEEFRFEPSANLPSADAVAALVADTYHIERLEQLGPIRLNATISMPKIELEGEVVSTLAWPDRHRYEMRAGSEHEIVAVDGKAVWHETTNEEPRLLEGARAETMRLESPFARYGDWDRWFRTYRVIQRIEDGGRKILMVRMGDTSATAITLYVDEESGRVLMQDSVADLGIAGRVGQRVEFNDFRDVSGILLPFHAETEMANPLIGTIYTEVKDVEVGVETDEALFDLSPDEDPR